MLTRHAITRRADRDGVDASVVERDYVLAHIVAQLSLVDLGGGGRLVFKGGTALRMVHIEDYRYSADLDFTVIDASVESATASLARVLEAAREHAGLPVLGLSEGLSPFIEYVGPLEAGKPRRIKLDVSETEVVEMIERRTILPGLWDDLPQAALFDAYSLIEITAEKLRCIMQRVQCRDLYDLVRLTEDLDVDLVEVAGLFERKATAKSLDPRDFDARFTDRLDRYRTRWESEMADLVLDPPHYDDVVRIVRRHLRRAGLIVP
jgi:predicted nucleotidyltransferase component of viral defense system